MSWLIKFLLVFGSLVMSFFPGYRTTPAAENRDQLQLARMESLAASTAARQAKQCTTRKQSPEKALSLAAAVNLEPYATDLSGERLQRGLHQVAAHERRRAAFKQAIFTQCDDLAGCDWKQLAVLPQLHVRADVPRLDVAQLLVTAENARQLARSAELKRLERASFRVESVP